jgi:CheY-like chemotaxis protein
MKARILVVVADEIVRVGLAEGLDREGFEPLQAGSIAAAMEFLDGSSVDLALADLIPEGADRFALLKRIRERHPDLPVVALAGPTAPPVAEVIASGAADCIQQPANVRDIVNRIQVVLDAAGLRSRLTREQNQLREKRLEADQRLAQAERARVLQSLASGLDRQLSGPCETLRRSVRILADGIAPDHPMKHAVQALDQAIGPLEALRTHLRRAARPLALRFEPVDLQVVLRNVLAAEPQAQLRSRHPHVRFTASLAANPLPIQGSAEAVDEVIRTLLVTAFSQLPRGGRVWIASGREQESPRDETVPEGGARTCAYLTVGFSAKLSAEQSDRFFEPFGLSPETAGEADEGFALSECQARVRGMRGSIRLQAAGEDGTETQVRLPLSDPAERTTVAPVESIRGHEEVLVVDDHTEQRLDTARLLEGLGYRVHAVASGREALQFARDHLDGRGPGAELILLDLVLGEDVDGVEVARRILDLAPESRILLAGGFVETDRVSEARRMGVLDYLRKPLTRESLGRAIRSALRDR